MAIETANDNFNWDEVLAGGKNGGNRFGGATYSPELRAEMEAQLESTLSTVIDDQLITGTVVGLTEREPMLVRALAMQIREQAYFARDPVPGLGDRMTRDAFYTEFRARGGVVLGEPTPPVPLFKDRVVIPGGKIERVSDYVALLRDLAALTPAEALAQFDLDEAGYLEVAAAWAVAMETDPSVAASISAGLAKR